jgi:hypothetical protein
MSKRKKLFVALVGVAVLAIGGVAVALWTANGSGSGQAEAISAITINVNATSGTADLYPGAAGDVYFTLTNDNPYQVTFASMTAGTVTVDAGHSACTPATYVTVDNVPSGLTLVAAANTTTGALSIDNVVHLDVSAPDACQGAVFTIPLTLVGSQS